MERVSPGTGVWRIDSGLVLIYFGEILGSGHVSVFSPGLRSVVQLHQSMARSSVGPGIRRRMRHIRHAAVGGWRLGPGI